MASSSHPSSAALAPPQWKHDVFLSFRGEDTRWGFVSNLYHELQEVQDIQTFKDDPKLETGSVISSELLTAIENSKFAVVVFSSNYASSRWCLDELSKIVECWEAKQIKVVPIFYKVDPSHVRNQRGSFAEAFTEHEKRFQEDAEKVKRWRADLTTVANLSGFDSNKYGTERQLITEIVDYVRNKVGRTIRFSNLDPRGKLVGVDSRLNQLYSLLALEANDVRFIGIWGMGGIGKTTLAMLLTERISSHFEVVIFVDAKLDSSVPLPKKIICQISKKQNTEDWDMIKKNLCKKKVLIFVDDGDRLNQLEILVQNKDWFGEGSRIIITTRDQHLLVQHGIDISYKVEELQYGDAIQLFSKEAFGKDQPEEEFLELSQSFVDYARGLPLALKLLGSSLSTRDRDYWKFSLRKLEKSFDATIFNCLKFSYDGLCEEIQSLFLDVAFCYKGIDKDQVIELLDNCGLDVAFCGRSGIDVLVEKSLLTIQKAHFHVSGNIVEMHDLIQEMAWEIVRRECKEEPGQRSRLCHKKDIFHVFENNTGTNKIQVLVLRLPKLEKTDWNCEAFSKMDNLRIVEFDNLIIPSGPKSLPNSLRLMKWSLYPSKFLPLSFQPKFLIELSLPQSNIFQLWENARVNLDYLKRMDLSYSENLISTPDFTGIPNMEKLDLEGCMKLVEVHPSISVLKKLKICNLKDCKSIKTLSKEVQMESLEVFDLTGCSKVKMVPEFSGQMKKLWMLCLSGTAIEKIPSSIKHLIGLVYLYISDCKSLSCLPSAICNLKSLEKLDISGCSKLDKLPENLGEIESLTFLKLERTNIRGPPPSLVGLKNLKVLSFRGSPKSQSTMVSWIAKSLLFGRKIPNPVGLVLVSLHGLYSLARLILSDCNLYVVPDTIGCLCSLKYLDMSRNNFVSLPASISRLSNLGGLILEGCTMLQQFPDLPSSKILHVNTQDCTSLRLLWDLPILDRDAQMWDFTLYSGNCFGLLDDEGRNTIIFPMLRRFLQGIPRFQIMTPGREIPEWFIRSELKEDSFIVELPSHSCREWMGIAFCVLFEDQANPATLSQFSHFVIELYSEVFFEPNSYTTQKIGHLGSDHLWVSYVSRQQWNPQCSEMKILIETYYGDWEHRQTCSIVKRCGFRLVFEKDVEELNQTLNQSISTTSPYCEQCDNSADVQGAKRTHDGGLAKESLCKRLKED